MSPTQILEPAYAAIKKQLLRGVFRPGQRIEAARLADDLGISVTPVRDVLNRLTGERLIIALAGDGFHAVSLTADDLNDLLQWARLLAELCARTVSNDATALPAIPQAADYPARIAGFFLALAGQTGNAEIIRAMSHVNDRLAAIRILEPSIFPDTEAELEMLIVTSATDSRRNLLPALRAYFRRRQKSAKALIRLIRSTSHQE